MPIMQIHGLQDGTVSYTGASWSLSIPNVMEYWSSYNACDEDPSSIITDLDNGSYILFDSYQNCSNNVGVELILHSTMGHTWPSLNSHSLSATDQIWSFFAKYDINGAIN
jgi:poly(3-hydroxybutyrate) depolymerase